MLNYVFSGDDTEGEPIAKILIRYCTSYEVINIRSNETENSFEYSYYIRVKKSKNVNQLLCEMRNMKGITNLNLFFDQQNS